MNSLISRRIRRRNRRGMGLVEWCVVAALLILVVVISVRAMGTTVNSELNDTAGDIANPANLKNRF